MYFLRYVFTGLYTFYPNLRNRNITKYSFPAEETHIITDNTVTLSQQSNVIKQYFPNKFVNQTNQSVSCIVETTYQNPTKLQTFRHIKQHVELKENDFIVKSSGW